MSRKTKKVRHEKAKAKKARNRKARKEKVRTGKPILKKSDDCYVFQVALKYAPNIWRTIALPGDATLDDFHWEIFWAFDREEEHLYSFYVPRIVNGRRSRNRDERDEYTSPIGFDPNPLFLFGNGIPAKDGSRCRLDRIGLALQLKFEYVFDFGDWWEHTITVKQIKKIEPDNEFGVIEKHGNSPPQYRFDDEFGDEEFDDEDDCEPYDSEVA